MSVSLFPDRKARAQRRAAIDIDPEAGVLEQCPVCRGIVDKLRDDRLPIADALATTRITERHPGVAAFDGDLEALLGRLRDVRREFRFSCRCEWAD